MSSTTSTPTYPQLDKIDASTDPKIFFDNYVSKRKPVVIAGLPNDERFKARRWTDLNYLVQKAGHVSVLVEPLHPTSKQYGTDVDRVDMKFGEFVESLRVPPLLGGSSLKSKWKASSGATGSNETDEGPFYYLTTQYAATDVEPDGEEEDEMDGDEDEEEGEEVTTLPPPTNALSDDFPLVPRLLGNLVLQQVNLWMGKSKGGSSSGLHHDFHDNLYCLLAGTKRFVLFPPSEHPNLYPHGTVETHHPNGLISYKGVEEVNADGLAERVRARVRVKAIEKRLAELGGLKDENDVAVGGGGGGGVGGKGKEKKKDKGKKPMTEAEKERQRLMKMHDEALDELERVTLEEMTSARRSRRRHRYGEDEEDEEDESDEDYEVGDGEVDDFDILMAGEMGDALMLEEEEGELEGEEEEFEEWYGIGVDSDDSGDSGDDEEGGEEDALTPDIDADHEEDEAEDAEEQDNEDEDEENEDEDEDEDEEEDEEDEEEDEPSEPPSFSQIPTAILHAHLSLPTTALPPAPPLPTSTSAPSSTSAPLASSSSSGVEAFPKLRKTCKPFVIHLNAGEMLYLPASWWHEVTSTSGPTTNTSATPASSSSSSSAPLTRPNGKTKTKRAPTDVHMAFNYWFYPPTSPEFEEPYEDEIVWGYLRERQTKKMREMEEANRVSDIKYEKGKDMGKDTKEKRKRAREEEKADGCGVLVQDESSARRTKKAKR